MSNSFKKHPIYKYHFKGGKRASAKKFRRYKGEIPITSRQFYRRIYNSWNVWDNWYWHFEGKREYKRYKQILKEIEQTLTDSHLTEEEIDLLIEELNDLRWCFFYKMK